MIYVREPPCREIVQKYLGLHPACESQIGEILSRSQLLTSGDLCYVLLPSRRVAVCDGAEAQEGCARAGVKLYRGMWTLVAAQDRGRPGPDATNMAPSDDESRLRQDAAGIQIRGIGCKATAVPEPS